MSRHRRFLVIDDNSDSRFLLVKTLLRKFPQSVIHECQDVEGALSLAAAPDLDAIVTHRAVEVDGVTLVTLLRKMNAAVPIVVVSGGNTSREALAAGATQFLNYDEWLRIGTVVADVLAKPVSERAGTHTDAAPSRPAPISGAPSAGQ